MNMGMSNQWSVGLLSFVGVLACGQHPQDPECTASAARGGDRCLGSKRVDVCQTTHKLIYGKDDRLDLHCLKDGRSGVHAADTILEQSKAVAAIFHKVDTNDLGNGSYELGIHHKPLKDIPGDEGLCEKQTFADQPRGASCGAVLVDTNTILTATHCFVTIPEPLFVFGFAMPAEVKPGFITVPSINVCKLAQDPRVEPVGPHLTLLDIDCPSGDPRTPARIAVDMPQTGDVYAIGFPRFLSAKFSGWGPMFPRGTHYFHAALDVSPGNSGGPVFAANASPNQHELVGILEGDKSASTCKDPTHDCRIWNTAKTTTKIEIVITSTHEVPKILARRNQAKKEKP